MVQKIYRNKDNENKYISAQHYIEAYNKKWDKCLKEAERENAKDVGEIATYIFEESANANEVVGYYLVYHKENALKDWKANTDGINMNEQDLEVDRILTQLCAKM